MRILVTGGAGFIGSHVVDAYLAAGHHVSVVDDLSHGRRENLPSSVTLYEVDLRSPDLAEAFADAKPDMVSHHAAQISVARSMQLPTEDAAVNVGGTVNVLQQAAQHGAEKVVFASSVAVYGDPQYQPCDESHPTQPLSPYGLSKLAGEMYVQLFSRLYGLRYTILRYGNVYGPRQDAEGEAGSDGDRRRWRADAGLCLRGGRGQGQPDGTRGGPRRDYQFGHRRWHHDSGVVGCASGYDGV